MQPQRTFIRAHEGKVKRVGRMEKTEILATLSNEKAEPREKVMALVSAHATIREKELEFTYGDPTAERVRSTADQKLHELWKQVVGFLADPDREVREFTLRAVEDISCSGRMLHSIYSHYFGVDYPQEIRDEAFRAFLRVSKRVDDKSIPEEVRFDNLNTLLGFISSGVPKKEDLRLTFSVIEEIAGRSDIELTPQRRNVTETVVSKLMTTFTYDQLAKLYGKIGRQDLTFEVAKEANYANTYEAYQRVVGEYERYLEIRDIVLRLFNDLAETNKDFGRIFIERFRQMFQYVGERPIVNDEYMVAHDDLLNIVATIGVNHSELKKSALETLEMSLRAPRYFRRSSADIEREVREILSHIARLGGRGALLNIEKEFSSEWGELKKVGEIAREMASQTSGTSIAHDLEGLL